MSRYLPLPLVQAVRVAVVTLALMAGVHCVPSETAVRADCAPRAAGALGVAWSAENGATERLSEFGAYVRACENGR